jgi:hypothetical protein
VLFNSNIYSIGCDRPKAVLKSRLSNFRGAKLLATITPGVDTRLFRFIGVAMVTRERIAELLRYDEESGVFTRKIKRSHQGAGSIAGFKSKRGHIIIGIDGVQYQAHRLAWLLVKGGNPVSEIVHINGNNSDNRILNLEEAGQDVQTLTFERLHELLSYDKNTGVFTWRKYRRGNKKVGSIAGNTSQQGYIRIRLDDISFQAHRLAWMYVNGYLPENPIDHVNRERSDNRISNLREVSIWCNAVNSKLRKDNTSGVRGVHWSNTRNKWRASIRADGKVRGLGRFVDFDEAVCHRLAVEQCLGWKMCDDISTARGHVLAILRK